MTVFVKEIVECVECTKTFSPTTNAWYKFKDIPNFEWLCVPCMRAGARNYKWRDKKDRESRLALNRKIELNLRPIAPPSTAKEQGSYDPEEKTAQANINQLIEESENLDPHWESKRDYLLYVRQLERLETDPRYIQ